jgi:hypothetical protein
MSDEMRPNPARDVLTFLTQASWPTAIFWLLLSSICIAAVVWRSDPVSARRGISAGWLLRSVIGAMWWQQSLWKIPPNYDGLIYWMKQIVDHASTVLQSALVRDVVLPPIHAGEKTAPSKPGIKHLGWRHEAAG